MGGLRASGKEASARLLTSLPAARTRNCSSRSTHGSSSLKALFAVFARRCGPGATNVQASRAFRPSGRSDTIAGQDRLVILAQYPRIHHPAGGANSAPLDAIRFCRRGTTIDAQIYRPRVTPRGALLLIFGASVLIAVLIASRLRFQRSRTQPFQLASALLEILLALSILTATGFAAFALQRHRAVLRRPRGGTELPRSLREHQRGRVPLDARRPDDQRQPGAGAAQRLRDRGGAHPELQRHRHGMVRRSEPARRNPSDAARRTDGSPASSRRSTATIRASASGSRKACGWCATRRPASRSTMTARCAKSPRRCAGWSCRTATTRSPRSSPPASTSIGRVRTARPACPMPASAFSTFSACRPRRSPKDASVLADAHPSRRSRAHRRRRSNTRARR